MFVPENTVGWLETAHFCRLIGARIFTAKLLERLGEDPSDAFNNNYINTEAVGNWTAIECGLLREGESVFWAKEAYGSYLLSRIMLTLPMKISTPTGSVREINAVLQPHADFPFDLFWDWRGEGNTFSFGDIEGYMKLAQPPKKRSDEPFNRFCIVDSNTGTIKVKKETPSLIEKFVLWKEDISEIIEAVAPYSGSAIFWDKNLIPNRSDELLNKLDVPEAQWITKALDQGKATNEGLIKPSLKHIYDCFMQAYPDGKTESWSVVEEKVGYSRRSINRALKEYGQSNPP